MASEYRFELEDMWRSEVPPRTGMTVEVQFDDAGVPVELFAVSESQVAKEQAQKMLDGALRQGGVLGASLKKTSSGKFSVVALVVQALLLLAFFVLPGMRFGTGWSSEAMSSWDATGFDPSTGRHGCGSRSS